MTRGWAGRLARVAPGLPALLAYDRADLRHDLVAGLSVAYHAKPAVRAQAMVAINAGGLDRLLEVVR